MKNMLNLIRQAAPKSLGAAFLLIAPLTLGQAPIIESGGSTSTGFNQPQQEQESSSASSEIFYQLQLLQQEVMQLRGQVEEQAYQIQQLKDQNMERYIDLDRRIGQLSTGQLGAAAKSGTGSAAAVSRPVVSQSKSRPVAQASTTRSLGAAKQGEKAAYDQAYGMVIDKKFQQALDAFKQFLIDFPNGRLAPNSYYWIGELYQVISPADLDAAREAFSQLIQQYPDHSKAPDAMYKLGKVYFLKGDPASSRQWLEKVVTQYGAQGNSSAVDKARQFLSSNF